MRYTDTKMVSSFTRPHSEKSVARWWRVALISFLLAAFIAATASAISTALSKSYYANASYHYDSAVYRLDALNVFNTLTTHGLGAALNQSLRMKDSFDITLRLLLRPRTLLSFYGHLAVLIPLALLLFILAITHVYHRTGSWLLGSACMSFLFVFSYIYDAWWGMADYWKDNIAAWLAGGIVLSWVLSQHMLKKRWAALAGLLFGILVMQRTAAAVYIAMLLTPVIVISAVIRRRRGGLARVLAGLAAFIIPAATLAALVVVFQWQDLYRYYFTGGYAYGSRSDVARYLLAGIVPKLIYWRGSIFGGLPYGSGPASLAAGAAALYLVGRFRPHGSDRSAAFTAAWMVAGLWLVVVGTQSYFHGFFAHWTTLWLVLLCTLAAAVPRGPATRATAGVLLILATGASAAQLLAATKTNDFLLRRYGAQRPMMEGVYAALTSQSRSPAFALLCVEFEVPLLNHAWFVHGNRMERSVIFFTPHDTHFTANFPGQSAENIVKSEMARLESYPGSMAVVFADPWRARNFSPDRLAGDVIEGFNLHVWRSPRWKAMRRIPSNYGELMVYRHTGQDLTPERKWDEVGGPPSPSKPTPSL